MSDHYPRPPAHDPVAIIDYQRDFYASGHAFLERLGLLGLIHGTLTDDIIGWASLLPERIQNAAVSTARDLQPMTMWREHRQVYNVHPAVTRSLTTMKSTTAIPGTTLRNLRHPNPLFTLPGGVTMTHADGHQGRAVGFYVTGAISGRYTIDPHVDHVGEKSDGSPMAANESVLRPTTDPDINAYHVLVVSEVLDNNGDQVIDHDFSRITIPIRDEFTLDTLVKDTVDGFRWGPELAGTLTAERKTAYMRSLTHTVVTHLLYAVSKTAEIGKIRGENRPPVKRRPGTPKPERSAKIMPVGYRMGTALEALPGRYENRQPDERTSVTTGRTMPPHIRAPHPHIYRVGPGRQDIELKWLDLIHVNAHLDDGTTATIRNVT